ncbi:MAG: FTR1 family protein [Bdellovibrionales bacterium]|nr:FTR1 family protein [Bdellovibrionales bacterium]
MISFALIVFREALEVALILGVLVAATKGVQNRASWIWAGVGLGLFGSAVVALSTERIARAVEGFGQEVFNAAVLLTAAVLITSTLIWMKRHSRELCARLREIGGEVSCGRRHHSVLALAVALSVLREGSEVVLLGHGMLAGGTMFIDVLLGSALGLGLGLLVGAGIYYGLLKAATRHIFSVTSFLLVLLSAGMVQQAVGFLSAADIVPSGIYPLWDTSWILSERSYLGQTLHVLIGYTARPSLMQIVSYVLTVLLVVVLLRRFAPSSSKPAMPKMSRPVTA